MSGIIGWYYLHDNGALIFKRELGDTAADIRESDFARAMWPFDPQSREGAWRIVTEASALGANKSRVEELAQLWGCTDQDADIYAEHIGVTIDRDGSDWCAKPPGFINLAEDTAGFGPTKREALADLCRGLGYRGGKTWAPTFAGILAARSAAALSEPRHDS